MERRLKRISGLTTTLIIGMVIGLSGCGSNEDNDDDGASGSSALVTGVSQVNSQLSAVSDTIGSSSGSSSVITPFSALDTVWTTTDGVIALSNSGYETLSDWLGHMFDGTFVNSNNSHVTFEGRLENNLKILCFVGAAGLPVDGTGLPADGTHSITITAAMLSSCNESDTSMVGYTVSVVAATLSDTTIYDKSFNFTLPGSESCPYKFLARANSSAVNIAAGEDQNCDGRDHASRAVMRFDLSSRLFRFYYVSHAFSGSGSGFEFYRGYYDETADEAYILGFYGGDTNYTSAGLNNYIGFTVAGKPSGSGTAAVSAKVAGQGSGHLSDGVYNGCVTSSNGTISSSTDTLSCTLTGTSMSSAYTQITTEYDSFTSRSQIYDIGATTDVDFTNNSDMY